MKNQKSFALLDALVLTIILTVGIFFASPAKAVEGDYTAISSEQLFDYCRADSLISRVTCGTYVLAVWDILSGNPYVCMNPSIVDDDTLGTALSQIIQQITMTSGYASEHAATVVLYSMFEANNLFTICPDGRGTHT